MSTINLKNIQLGDNPDPSKNFVLSVPAVSDGTLSIKRQDGTNVLSIDAAGKAVIPGVVGTVAQVGGIPTGQVVERGSNANGEYVRFADGTQICILGYTSLTGKVTAGAYNLMGTVFFAAAFVANPAVSCQVSGWMQVASGYSLISVEAVTTTSFRPVILSTHSYNGYAGVRIIAIGRWF